MYVRRTTVCMWNRFLHMCSERLDNYNVRDEAARTEVTQNALRCMEELQDRMFEAVRDMCHQVETGEELNMRLIEDAVVAFKTSGLPGPVANCMQEAVVDVFGSESVNEIKLETVG